jgi:hypothetical protein
MFFCRRGLARKARLLLRRGARDIVDVSAGHDALQLAHASREPRLPRIFVGRAILLLPRVFRFAPS